MILVTGAAGFIGSNLVHALLSRNKSVIAVDRFPNQNRYLEGLPRLACIDMDRLKLDELPKLEGVFHQGACTDTMEKDEGLLRRLNDEASVRIAHFCERQQIPLIYASSASVYGAGSTFREDPAFEAPINGYAHSKHRFDQWVRAQAPGPRFGLRYFNVYGPNEAHKGPMASILYQLHRQLLQNDTVTLFGASHGYGPGEQARDFVAVEDVVAVNLWFFDHWRELPGGIYNVGSGSACRFNRLAEAVLRHHGRGNLQYRPFPSELLSHYQPWTQADLSRLRAVGYQADFTPPEQGFSSYLRRLETGA